MFFTFKAQLLFDRMDRKDIKRKWVQKAQRKKFKNFDFDTGCWSSFKTI